MPVRPKPSTRNSPNHSRSPSQAITWIKNARVFSQDSDRRFFKAHLRIVEGRIERIAKTLPDRFERDALVLDARDQYLFPGFVQTHVHLCQTLFRNQADDLELLDWLAKRIWLLEAAHTPESLKASALLGIHELLTSGTTTVLDMGTVRHTEAIIEAALETGIRASIGKCLMDHPEYTPPGLREKTGPALKEALDLHAKWHGCNDGQISISLAPRFAISCTEGLLREVATHSAEQGILVHTHASENRKEIELVRKISGRDNIQYFKDLGLTSNRLVLAHGVWLSQKERRILADSGTHITHCPSSNLKLASGIAPVPELLALGVNVCLGADGAPCNNHLNQLEEMRLAALLHKPGHGPKTLRAQEALDMGTLNGAKALGLEDEIGSIEVGKRADLVLFDLNRPENLVIEDRGAGRLPSSDAVASSLVYSTQPHHLQWTMVDGEVVQKHGELAAISTESLVRDVRRAQLSLRKKVDLPSID
jgi:5-methylthioadenosine/S-adenosylhomocysteine deaminase